ncbi:MAG: ankyrin repeat domain-containing protein [Alphaproteobacteria bacterium]|nr:MAG: ankyrin repeat domain-containing protein [Alphaproteobacteria bacterium]
MTDHSASAEKKDAVQARALAKPIYDIINRLAQPPTAEEYRLMKDLIRQGADLEVRYNDGNHETLLEIALAREYTDAALFLINQGADIHARCVQDITPFIFTAMKGNAKVMQAMLETGMAPLPDRDFYDSLGEGKTALMCAAEWGRIDCAVMLIRNGADMNLKNNVGKSALAYAQEKDHKDIVAGMQLATADVEGEKFSKSAHNGASAPVRLMKTLRLKASNANKGPG